MGHAIGEKYQAKIEECKAVFEKEASGKNKEIERLASDLETLKMKAMEDAKTKEQVKLPNRCESWVFVWNVVAT